jgi:RNA-dependent RNA polymerase
MNHSLREVKFKARISVPKSYQLVGVADEGQAYIEEGVNAEDVFTLSPSTNYGASLRGSTPVLPYANGNIQSACRRRRMNHQSTSRARHPEVRSFTLATVQICFLRCLKNIVVLPAVSACQRVLCMPSLTNPPSRSVHWNHALPEAIWMGTYYMARRLKYSQRSSDTHEVYYENPGLIPHVQTAPMEDNESTPWTVDKDRGDSTVEDICDFIVEYINSDVMVCPRLCPVLAPLSSFLSAIYSLLADRHIVIADQSKGGTLFVYDLTASSAIDTMAYSTIGA